MNTGKKVIQGESDESCCHNALSFDIAQKAKDNLRK